MSLDSVPLIKRRRVLITKRRTRLAPVLPRCGRSAVTIFSDASALANANSNDRSSDFRRCINNNNNNTDETTTNVISARYDPSIVYAVDEILTRGAYSVLARWICSYVNETDLPGCLVVVGYEREGGAVCENKTMELTPGHKVPYVTLNATLDYPIFEFKRSTGFPIVIVLITLHASKLGHDLSCDGRIDIHPRDSMQRSCKRLADALSHVAERYLIDLFHQDKRGGGCSGVSTEERDATVANDDDDSTATESIAESTTSTVEAPPPSPPQSQQQ